LQQLLSVHERGDKNNGNQTGCNLSTASKMQPGYCCLLGEYLLAIAGEYFAIECSFTTIPTRRLRGRIFAGIATYNAIDGVGKRLVKA